MVAMMDALDLSPVRFRPKTLTDPVRLREDWEKFWRNWNGSRLATHSEALQSASGSTSDLVAAAAAAADASVESTASCAAAPKPQRRQLRFDDGESIAKTPSIMAWTIGQSESSEDDDEILFGYSPSLQMAIDVNEKPDPVKIKHERHVFRTKTLLTANSLYRQLSESENQRLAEYGIIEAVQLRRRRLSDSGIVLSFRRSNSFDESSPPSLVNISISMGKKRVSFCAENKDKTPVMKKNSKIDEYLNDRFNLPKPILMKRSKSDPCPLDHMDYPTFKAWRRGRRMSLEAIKAAALNTNEDISPMVESTEWSMWKLLRWFRQRNVVCCRTRAERFHSPRFRPQRNDRVAAVSKILTPITMMTNEPNVADETLA